MVPRGSRDLVALLFFVCSAFGVGQGVTVAEGVPRFDPALGAIGGNAKWKETVFVILSADGQRVAAIPKMEMEPYGTTEPFSPPPGFGPRRFFMEIKPGKYMVLAMAPGKRLARSTIEVAAGKLTFFWAILEEERSELKVDKSPREKKSFFRTKAQALEEARSNKQPSSGDERRRSAK